MDLDVFMNFGVLKGGYENDQMVKGAYGHYQNYGGDNGNGYWDIALGDYNTPGKGIIDWGGDWLELEAETYFMAGHNVPTSLPPLPDEIEQLLNAGSTSDGDNSVSVSAIETDEIRDSESMEELKTGGGIAHGATVRANIDLDMGLLYGDFKAVVGHDINISQDEDRVCYSDNNSAMTPGVNGWYGTGQAYAGIEGELGVKAKIFGKEQRVQIMELGAAMALEGGAPNPVWFEGRANVTYSVLQGTLEGSSRFAISLGDKCQVDEDQALADITFIGEMAPEGNDVNPYSDPAVSFNLPMDEILYIPQVNDEGEEIVNQYLPYLDDFSIEESGKTWEPEEENWNNDKTLLKLRFDDPFTAKEGKRVAPRFDLEAVVKAKKWSDEAEDWEVLYMDGKVWEERKNSSFKTGEHPQTFDDSYVLYSNPLNRQRYFLQDEVRQIEMPTPDATGKSSKGGSVSQGMGIIDFKQNMSGFFPESDEKGNYEYLLRFKTLEADDKEVELSSLAGQSQVSEIHFELPHLENESLYAVQIVKRNTQKTTKSTDNISGIREQSFTTSNEENDTYSHYSLVSHAASAQQLSEVVERNETLLYVYYFQTSAYDNLADKLAAGSLNQTQDDLLELVTDEPFDQYDIWGGEDGDGDPLLPRVSIKHSFTGAYYEDRLFPMLLEPASEYETHMGSNPRIVGMSRYLSHPYLWLPEEDLNLGYGSEMSYELNEEVISGMAGPLQDREIQQTFSELFQTFSGGKSLSKSGSSPAGLIQSSNGQGGNLQFSLGTMTAAEEDAGELTNWASRLLDRYFVATGGMDYHYQNYMTTSYPEFLDWYDELLNRGDALSNYQVFQKGSPGKMSSNIKGQTGGKSSGIKEVSSSSSTTYQIEVESEKALNLTGNMPGSSATFEVDMK